MLGRRASYFIAFNVVTPRIPAMYVLLCVPCLRDTWCSNSPARRRDTAVNREVLAQAGMPTRAGRTVLDMDSSESPVHGAQEGSAYNGHFESVCYHPLFLFTEHGDCVAATLRPGNVHSADVGRPPRAGD